MSEATKTCSKCGETKNVTEFFKDETIKDKLHSSCKTCAGEASKKWVKANPNYSKQQSKKWCAANLERAKESRRKWRENNPNYFKEWYEANSERHNETGKRWCEANSERVKENHRKWREANPDYKKTKTVKRSGR